MLTFRCGHQTADYEVTYDLVPVQGGYACDARCPDCKERAERAMNARQNRSLVGRDDPYADQDASALMGGGLFGPD